MDFDRLKHTLAVARKMVEIAISLNLSEKEQKDLFTIGFNHDIGYEFTENGIDHGKIGGNILKDMGFLYWQEIYYHGEADTNYNSLYLDILNKADMQIDKYGQDVGFQKRLDDIKSRYGEESVVYKKCSRLVKKLIMTK